MEDSLRSAQRLMKRHQWRRALRTIVAVPRNSRTFELWWNHGWALGKLNDWKRAVRSLAMAVRKKPDAPIGLWALGLAHGEAGHPRLAERYHLAALALSDSTLARLTLAWHYMRQNKFAAAEQVHREGIALRPRHRERQEAYADFLSDLGRHDEVRVVSRQARKLPKPSKRRKRRTARAV